MKGKTKTQKGITLIALIITVVVLLILAAVAINSIQNDGILGHAENAAKDYNKAVKNEQGILGGYEEFLENGGSYIAKIVDKNGNDLKNQKVETNTTLYDKYGNKIVVPAGFKIRVDETTNYADTVTEGIVIEDKDGNQFVWIPCGTIYTSTDKSTSEKITLGRYSWDGSTGTLVQPTADNPYTSNVAIKRGLYNYTEFQSGSTTPTNAIARNISDFYESVMGTASKEGNGGYYIGRYEAGDSSKTTVANRKGTSGTSTAGTLVCKANQVPYNWILQSDASSKCKNMYPDRYKNDGTGTFSSDLINSYAWDTAIIFIQTFGTKSNSSTYANTVGTSSTDTSAPQTTGVNILNATSEVDEQLNIYDMAGNCIEWSTETANDSNGPCVRRGGIYGSSISISTSFRDRNGATVSNGNFAFRPLIYVGL